MDSHTRLLQVLTGVCVATVIAVLACSYVLYQQIAGLDRKTAALQRATQSSIERLTTLTSGNSTGIVTLLKAHAGLEQQLARVESAASSKSSAASAAAPSDLTPTETAGLRALFNLARNASATPRYKIGDKIQAAELKPLPDSVIQAFPRFKETKFLIDQNGALVLTAGTDNAVVLVVEPG